LRQWTESIPIISSRIVAALSYVLPVVVCAEYVSTRHVVVSRAAKWRCQLALAILVWQATNVSRHGPCEGCPFCCMLQGSSSRLNHQRFSALPTGPTSTARGFRRDAQNLPANLLSILTTAARIETHSTNPTTRRGATATF
jgi:hypothetical protein